MSTKVLLLCKKCQREFLVYRCRAGVAKYCTPECAYSDAEWRRSQKRGTVEAMNTEEIKERMRAGNARLETRTLRAESTRRRWADPAGNLREVTAESRRSPEARARQSEISKTSRGLWIPSVHAKILAERLGNGWLLEYPFKGPRGLRAIADLANPGLRLIVEVDGESHHRPRAEASDKRRTEYLNSLGWTVLRISNEAVERGELPPGLQEGTRT